MRGWGMCEAYEKEALRLATQRTAEDDSRNISAEGYASIWTENDQRALEYRLSYREEEEVEWQHKSRQTRQDEGGARAVVPGGLEQKNHNHAGQGQPAKPRDHW